MLRYVVLGLLRDGVPRHGYALMKAYRARGGISISTGNFYRELQRLTAAGLVRPAARPDGADPRQTPYCIAMPGIAAFDLWFTDFGGPGTGDAYAEAFATRLLFLGDVDPDVGVTVLERWQDDLWLRAKTLERAREAALKTAGQSPSVRFDSLPVLISRRLRHVAADVTLVEELRLAYGRFASARLYRQPDPAPSESRVGLRPKTSDPSRVGGGVAARPFRSLTKTGRE